MLLWRPYKGYCTHLHFVNFLVVNKYENFLNDAWVSCTPLWWRFALGQHTADDLLRLRSYNILQFSFNCALNNRDRTVRMCVQWLNSLLCGGTSCTFLSVQPAYNNCNNGGITNKKIKLSHTITWLHSWQYQKSLQYLAYLLPILSFLMEIIFYSHFTFGEWRQREMN